MSLRKDLVRGTDPPTEQNTHTTTDNNMHVVYMARNDLRVPTTTLHRQKTQGGWAMLDVAVKCRRLRLFHMWMLNSRESSVTASWLEHWSLKEPIANPPNRNTIPNKLTYVTPYALDMAYVNPPANTETHKKFKRRLYKGLYWRTPNEKIKNCESLRNTRQSPGHVCGPQYTTWIPERLKSLWYTVIRDIVPTNERLAAIQLSGT